MRPHYSHSSREDATLSSGTSLLASFKGVTSPGGVHLLNFIIFILFTFSSAMEWSEDQNLTLVREVLIREPYRFKERTTERGKVWQQIADNLNSDHTLKFPLKKFGCFFFFLKKLES